MRWNARLRAIGVGRRLAVVLGVVLLPLAVLSVVSVRVLEDQEIQFREAVDESVGTLLPLTTLEHYLQRALVDELEADSNESVPNFAALTENIDRTFATVEQADRDTDARPELILDAQRAWTSARPSVQLLVEQTHASRTMDEAVAARSRAGLEKAIADVTKARTQLAEAVRERYHRAIASRYRQLHWLVAAWLIAIGFAALLMALFLRSVLRPIRELGTAARQLGEGQPGVLVAVQGADELTALAERFNEMASYWEASRRSLLTEAAQDPLTGVLNRRGILAALEAELMDHAREQAPMALLVIDLDRFKAINDRFGHSAGDRALVWAVQRMRQALREGDHLGRQGGDEFLAVLPHTTMEQATQVAERLTRTIADAAAREPSHPAVTVGLSGAPTDGWDATALIEAADRRLYERKAKKKAGPVTPLRSG